MLRVGIEGNKNTDRAVNEALQGFRTGSYGGTSGPG